MKSIFNKNYSLLIVLILLGISNASTFIITKKYDTSNNIKVKKQSLNQIQSNACSFKVRRLGGLHYIKPLLLIDNLCQGDKLMPLKSSLNILFDNFKKSGVLNSASFYMKDYSNNDWMAINEYEKYSPGSLLKVPQLITILKMNEENPGFLNKKIPYVNTLITDKKPIYTSKSIKPGQSYTVKELLVYMIQYSDNNATMLLNGIIDIKIFKKVFTDLGLSEPDWYAKSYPISANEYSVFLRVLFNSGYLNMKDSEFALRLLTKSDFKNGIVNGLPANVQLAHKFGESGDASEKQLHESAIVYLNNNPFLITIMTKGKDLKKLPEVIKEASNLVYNHMQILQIASK
jgi:beta-lactamase class A